MKKILTIVLIILAGCTNPFSTRQPEAPEPTQQIPAINSLQNDPDSLLSKLQLALKEENRIYYRDCLADSSQQSLDAGFTFVANQNDRPRLQNWTLQDEVNYFDQLINNPQIQSIKLQIYNKEPEWTPYNGFQDQLQNRFSYQIKLQYLNGEELYEGQCIMRIIRSSQSLWYIYYWEDLQLTSDQILGTWSTLKANYR